jgi:plastocyanin
VNRRLAPPAARGWRWGLVLGACAAALGFGRAFEARAAAPAIVEINHFQFSPREITVEAGTVVEWTNHDQIVHNIIAPDVKLSSPGMDTGDHFDYTFAKPGDYPYLCGLHPHMTGVIHVRAPGNSG